MTTKLAPLGERPAWKALQSHYEQIRDGHLKELFAEDSSRGDRFTVETSGIFLDYSKNRITDETLRLLIQLAEECGLKAHIEAMFRGEKINITENRAVLHVALRASKDESIFVDGVDFVPPVHEVLDKMAVFCLITFVPEHGRGTPASGFAMSSTSASVGLILDR